MKTITEFIDKWAIRVMFPLVIIVFFKTCNTNNKVEKTREELTFKVDSINNVVKQSASKPEIEKMIKIEGLKSEKRMIQSTDRKILDVNRQSEIDKEIETLNK
ncbi:MAG: hypothetical protein ACK5OW_00535 [bacterium]|jgi:hypothetical protein